MPAMSDAEARTYLASKGVSAFIDKAIMKMLEEKPDDPVDWLQAYAARTKKGEGGKAPTGVVSGVRPTTGPMWSQIAAKIPASRTNADKLARAEMFNKIDINGNQSISEPEAIQGLKSSLPLKGKETIDYVMHRAYLLVRKITKGKAEVRPNNTPPDGLTRPQFKLLLMYLKRYCELLAIFDEFDSDDDMMVDFQEFQKVAVKLEASGMRVYYPDKAFQTLDKDKKGEIPFIDFAEFFIAKELELEPVTNEEELQAGIAADMKSNQAGGRMKSMAVSSFRRGRSGAIDWAIIAERLPYGKSPVEKARRDELWRLLDVNGNNYLSLAEVDKGMRDILKLEEIFDCKPAMLRAFQAAKDVKKDTRAALGHDFVTKCEFRILLEYLRMYFELFVMFDRLDDDNDRRISEDEFVRHGKMLTTWGVKSKDFRAEFKKIDVNGGGKILFDEFCHWAIPQNLDLEDDDE